MSSICFLPNVSDFIYFTCLSWPVLNALTLQFQRIKIEPQNFVYFIFLGRARFELRLTLPVELFNRHKLGKPTFWLWGLGTTWCWFPIVRLVSVNEKYTFIYKTGTCRCYQTLPITTAIRTANLVRKQSLIYNSSASATGRNTDFATKAWASPSKRQEQTDELRLLMCYININHFFKPITYGTPAMTQPRLRQWCLRLK